MGIVASCSLDICREIGNNIDWECMACSLFTHYSLSKINVIDAPAFVGMVRCFTVVKMVDWTVTLYVIGDVAWHNEEHYGQVLCQFVEVSPLHSRLILFEKEGHTLHRVTLD